jgi:hypothetical protein
MPQAICILLGAAFTVAVSLAAGRMLLRGLAIKLYRQEEHVIAFVTGAACLSLVTFLLCAAGAARLPVFLATGSVVLVLAFRRGVHRPYGDLLPPLPALWKWLFRSIFAAFFVLYFFNAMAPEMSPDGSTYHLGLVSRYLRAHGFERVTTNMYANLSQGVEMLFLFAFSIGRHSAAALTHFAFLIALTFAMLCYARRFGFPAAGVCGALLVFVSPVVGMDGTVAYNDVATACIVFTAFYLVQIWAAEDSNRALLIPLGLVSGFGYAAKYTAFLAVPYVLAIVGWKSIRRGKPVLKPLAIVAGCAALMILPWMAKNTIWLNNPVSPFLNQLFPNPYIHISFEKDYGQHMRHYGLKSDREIPLEVTVRGGALCGLLGPMFLLAPLGLLALRSPAGRQLLLAALVFLIPYSANIGTRFLIPALPFVALSMGLAVSGSNLSAVTLTLAHAILCWPLMLSVYCPPDAWRLLAKIPLRQALRIEPEESYLNFRMAHYGTALMIDKLVPPGGKVFSFSGAPEAYTSRDILVAYQSAFGNLIGDILWTPLIPEVEPRGRMRFRYPSQRLRQIRVVQTAWGAPDHWSVGELRIFRGETELPRAPDWKLRAKPNPWDVQLAFDNSPVTRWRSWQTLYPGMYLGVEFGSPEVSDSVLLECAHDQYKVRMKLEGLDEMGKWKTLAEAPEESDTPPQLGLRAAAARELKARGVDYLLIYDYDFGFEDFKIKSRLWGATLLGEHNGARLYRFDDETIPRR